MSFKQIFELLVDKYIKDGKSITDAYADAISDIRYMVNRNHRLFPISCNLSTKIKTLLVHSIIRNYQNKITYLGRLLYRAPKYVYFFLS